MTASGAIKTAGAFQLQLFLNVNLNFHILEPIDFLVFRVLDKVLYDIMFGDHYGHQVECFTFYQPLSLIAACSAMAGS